jgi:WW domain-containing oxidoreductase
LAHFYLATELLPELQAVTPSRVVVLSSGSHFGPLGTSSVASLSSVESLRKYVSNPEKGGGWGIWRGFQAYGNAKLCNCIFALSFNNRYGATGVSSCSLHPGSLMATEIARESSLVDFFLGKIMSWFTKSMDQGSSTTLSCCLRDPEELQGRYFADCQVATCSTRVTEKENQDALWSLSEELCAKFRDGGRQ